MIYLDNNATTRMSTHVESVMRACLEERLVNPASSHRLGQQARRRLEHARRAIAAAIGVRMDVHPPDRLIFTSGATEANHLAIRGLAATRPGAVVISSIEHPSVLGAAEHLEKAGREIRRIGCDSSGRIDLAHLRTLLASPVAVVALMRVNNETGVIQPVYEAAQLCRTTSTPIHCDAVQSIGKLPTDFRELDVDSMSFNAHKLHGPVGVGALAVRAGVDVSPLMIGGGQQLGTRPGTESVLLATGFSAAVESWLENAETHRQRLDQQHAKLEQRLLTLGPESAVIHGATADRISTTTSVSFIGINRQELLMALDLDGVACSTGSACASGSSEPSHVLQAMGATDEQVESGLRLSLSADTSDDDVRQGADRILNVVRRLKGVENQGASGS